MGKRGPKPKFTDVACPNEQCSQFGITEEGNVTVYGTYQINSGKNQTARGHPTLKGWGMLRAARFV